MEASDVNEVESFDSEDFVKNNLFETENFFCDVYCFVEGQVQEPHVHEGCDKIYRVLDGEARVSVGEESMVLEEGGAVLAPAGEAHGVEALERSRLLVYMAPHPANVDTGCEHGEGQPSGHGEHEHEDRRFDFGFVTVSSSRDEARDRSGDRARELVEDEGHELAEYTVVGDDAGEIQGVVEEMLDVVDVVVTSGGTGLTADDVTPEAVSPLFDKEVPGFGEEFRRRSVEEVGTRGILTRSTAGVVDDSVVFVLPGSPGGVETGLRLVFDEVRHMLGLVRREL